MVPKDTCPLPISLTVVHIGRCQHYGPFLGTLNIWCRIIIRTHKRDHNFDKS